MARLLLVDDSPTLHRIVELTFAREDVQVVSVRDGEQAVRAMSSSRPDVVLADHAAAGRNGYELAAFVKSQPDLAGVRVLLMAGAFEPVDEQLAAQSGSDGVVVKPLEPRSLVERVRSLLAPGPMVPAEADAGLASIPEEMTEAARRPDDGLDDYFDRLDAALGHLRAQQAHPAAAPLEPEQASRVDADAEEQVAAPVSDTIARDDLALPTVESLLGGVSADVAPRVEPVPEAAGIPDVSRADEALVEEVTRRVLERLAPDAVDRVVREIVLEVAERRVLEEVERIRTAGEH